MLGIYGELAESWVVDTDSRVICEFDIDDLYVREMVDEILECCIHKFGDFGFTLRLVPEDLRNIAVDEEVGCFGVDLMRNNYLKFIKGLAYMYKDSDIRTDEDYLACKVLLMNLFVKSEKQIDDDVMVCLMLFDAYQTM